MSRFGPEIRDNGVLFRLWAPSAASVDLIRPDLPPLPLSPMGDGFFEAMAAGAGPGARYRFRIGELDVPDPASRRQDGDVSGWSVVLLPQRGSGERHRLRPTRLPWREAIIAEVHVGTASPEGTYVGLAKRLGYFADAGYTVIELMPVAEFPGARSWGYDGVLPFAPDAAYGTPDDLAGLVEAAHVLGLGIILDVVYNHFGPSGNYLHLYAEPFFTERFHTPWGAAIALDEPAVRAFFVENACMWLDDYDFDGLRFDAVHAFRTKGAPLLLREIAEAARAIKPDAFLVLENDDNAARWLERTADGQPRHYTAQWNDDFHHALLFGATGDSSSYYADYGPDPLDSVARTLAEGFVFQGTISPFRKAPRGEPSARLPPEAFVAFAQNHDQIGNRPLGERLTSLVTSERHALLRFVTMLSPQTPLFFMGEEAAIETPFPYFCDFDGELGESIRQGRKREFAHFYESHDEATTPLPDPLVPDTFAAARLPWDAIGAPKHAAAVGEFKALAAARARLVWPLAASAFFEAASSRAGSAIAMRWHYAAGDLVLILNMADTPGRIAGPGRAPDVAVGSIEPDEGCVTLGPWSAAVWADMA